MSVELWDDLNVEPYDGAVTYKAIGMAWSFVMV